MANSPKITPNNKTPFRFSLWWMYGIVIVFLIAIFYLDQNTVTKEVPFTTFESYVEKDHGIKKIIVYTDGKKVEGFLTDSLAKAVVANQKFPENSVIDARVIANVGSSDQISNKIDYWRSIGAFTGEVEYEQSSMWSGLLVNILPFALLILFWIFLMRRMSPFPLGYVSAVAPIELLVLLYLKRPCNASIFQSVKAWIIELIACSLK